MRRRLEDKDKEEKETNRRNAQEELLKEMSEQRAMSQADCWWYSLG